MDFFQGRDHGSESEGKVAQSNGAPGTAQVVEFLWHGRPGLLQTQARMDSAFSPNRGPAMLKPSGCHPQSWGCVSGEGWHVISHVEGCLKIGWTCAPRSYDLTPTQVYRHHILLRLMSTLEHYVD